MPSPEDSQSDYRVSLAEREQFLITSYKIVGLLYTRTININVTYDASQVLN